MRISADTQINEDMQPTLRSRRGLAIVLSFILLLIILFGLLWLVGPLPRVFPAMCSNGCIEMPPIRMP